MTRTYKTVFGAEGEESAKLLCETESNSSIWRIKKATSEIKPFLEEAKEIIEENYENEIEVDISETKIVPPEEIGEATRQIDFEKELVWE